MLTLTCSKCGAAMAVDDGFAGGTCRCQACGTIQTVPASAGAKAKVRGGERLFERAGDVATASIVPKPLPDDAKSGRATESDIARPRPPRATRPPKPAGPLRRAWPATLLVAIAGTVAIAMAVLLMRRLERVAEVAPEVDRAATPVTRRAATRAAVRDGPRFGPIRLDGAGRVIYLLDRDRTTAGAFAPAIYRAVVASIETLPDDRAASVQFFATGGERPIRDVSRGDLDGLLAWMSSVPSEPEGEAIGTLADALGQRPAEIVLITGRGWRFNASFATRSIELARGQTVKIHTVSLGTADAAGPLSTLAEATGGEAIAMTVADAVRLAESTAVANQN